MHTEEEVASARRGLVLRPLPEQPFCTLIIPCLNEEHYIEAAVACALRQRYPTHRMELFVVDGGSTDRTRAIVQRIAARDRRVKLLDNPRRIQAAAMNIGIKRARGDVIVRMDAHAEYADDYVAQSVAALRRTGALNVGGAARARWRTPFQRALCAALSSPLGVGGSAYRDPSREGFVESVFNGSFRREVFELVGLYDPDAATNEDAELNQRIIEAGGSVYLARGVVAHYYPRTSLGGLARQYFSYGNGRARTMLRRGRLLSVRPLVPCAMVTAFLLLALGALFHPAFAPVLAALAAVYALLLLAESARVALRTSPRDLAWLPVIFFVMHASHGVGLWAGLARNARSGIRFADLERLTAR